MIVLLAAFSAFHLCVGAASLALAARLLTEEERAHWRETRARVAAEVTCWVYPLAALACTGLAWADYAVGRHESVPIILAPLAWLILMGMVFAVVDFAEDGVLGNSRGPAPRDEPRG